MFHEVKSAIPLDGMRLVVQFCEGVAKIYDASLLGQAIPAFRQFEEHPETFQDVQVDVGGYGVVWSDDLDLSCDELWEKGEAVSTNAMERECGLAEAR